MTEAKRFEDPDFFFGNLGNPSIHTGLVSKISNLNPEFYLGETGYGHAYDPTIRDCEVGVVSPDDLPFITTALTKIVENINDLIWKFNLVGEWESSISVVKYSKPGHHFDWHRDHYDIDTGLDVRKITVVYSLAGSEDYTGGEFMLKREKTKEELCFKFERGDFIVFPSPMMHRVLPLKTGTRCTMVGWYR